MSRRGGLWAEFETPEAFARAYEQVVADGYTDVTTFTPYAVKTVVQGVGRSRVPWVMLGAGCFGAVFGYLLQWWCSARSYPINVGGRPLNSVPAFIPITFESAVLASCLAGFFVLLGLCGLPRLSHPAFEVEGFERASVDRFWIGVAKSDPEFAEGLEARLVDLGALRCAHTAEAP
jgi:hypothetical protein